MIGDAIYEILSTHAETSALVGTHIFPNLVPQGKPTTAAWYDTEDVSPLKCQDSMGAFDGFIEVGSISEDYDTMIAILRAIRKALDNFDGVAAGFSLRIYTGTEGQAGFDETLKLHGKSLRWKILGQSVTP